MSNANIVYSSTWTRSVFVRSGSPLAVGASVLNTRTQNILTTADSAPTAVISSNGSSSSRRLSNRTQRSRWFSAGSSVSLEPTPAPGNPPQRLDVDAAEALAGATPTETVAKRSRTERIELAIDSLPHYELIKPIPVLVESIGDKVFVAEAPDLNVSTTGNSVGAAFLLLKEHIVTTYEGYSSKKGQDSERARQLGIFEKYLTKTRRHWF